MSETQPLLKDAVWLQQGVLAQLIAVLSEGGEEARVVGGAVRNALLGEPIGDIDIATTVLPAEVMRRAAAVHFKPVPTGIEHGTVTVVTGGQPFEVTTLREDVETFGRHATVRFGRDWRKDAQRRDFTMNALSASGDGAVHDYVGGIADLRAHRVRFIGDAATRIAEDHLRILRFFRFHAAYGHGLPDRDGLNACISARGSLEQLSRERVRMEMLKLLVARHAAPVLAVMAESGLLGSILGGVADLAAFENLVKIESVLRLAADPVRRLGALAARITEDAERLWQRLRLSNAEHERIESMSEIWWRISPANENAARALLYRAGPARYVDRVLMAWVHSPEGARDAAWRALSALPERWSAPAFPIKAAELIARGVPHGPAVGIALRTAEDAWIAAGFPADRSTLTDIAAAATEAATRR